MLTTTEGTNATKHDRIYVARVDRPDAGKLQALVQVIMEPGWNAGEKETVQLLQSVVPEFRRREDITDAKKEYHPVEASRMVVAN